MNPEQLKEDILIHLQNGSVPDDLLLAELQRYKGDDVVLLGAQAYLLDHGSEQFLKLSSELPDMKIRPLKKYRILAIAASLLIFVFAAWIWIDSREDPYKLIEEGTPVFMGDYHDEINDFMNAYRTGEYETVLQIGSEKLLTQPSDTLVFYLACASNYTKDFLRALDYIDGVTTTSIFFNAAQYQKAYAFYKLKKMEAARTALLPLMRPDNPYFKPASDLFKAMP